MTTVTVGATATLVAAADGNRGDLTVQHVDVEQGTVRVWLAPSASVAVGAAMLLTGGGISLSISGPRAAVAWYAIAEEDGVVVAVETGSKWDSQT